MSSRIREELVALGHTTAPAFSAAAETIPWTGWRIGAVVALGAFLGAGAVLAVAPSPAGAEPGDAGVMSFFRTERAARARAPTPTTVMIHPSQGLRSYAPLPAYGQPLPAAVRSGRFDADPGIGKAIRRTESPPAPRKTVEAPVVPAPVVGTGYCQRTCDGLIFPRARVSVTGAGATADEQCQAACPGAVTRATATPAAGQILAALKRPPATESCTCAPVNGRGPLAATRDFTLRPGDVVVGRQSTMVFRGSQTWPFRPGDFAGFDGAASPLSRDEKRAVDRVVGASHYAKALTPYTYAKVPPKAVAARRAQKAEVSPAAMRPAVVSPAAYGPQARLLPVSPRAVN